MGSGTRPTRLLVTRLWGFTERRWVAREDALAAELRLGNAAVVTSEVRTVIAEAPLRENAWRLLIRAQYHLGDVDGALRSFRELTDILARELGVGPSAQTEALVRTIVRHTNEPVPARR